METIGQNQELFDLFLCDVLTKENTRNNIKVFPKENERRNNMTIDLRRLKAERIAKGLSQEEMAELLGWKSRATYSKRETGRVNIGADELARIADILGYSSNQLGIFFTVGVPKRERS